MTSLKKLPADEHFNLGVQYFEQNSFEIAIEEFTQEISLNSNYGNAYYNRGLCYLNLKKYEESLVDLTKYIELSPDYFLGYFNRGLCYFNLKKYEESIKELTKSIELNRNYYEAYNNRGLCYLNLEKYEESLVDFTKSIELSPKYTEAYNNRGLCYLALKKYEASLMNFTKAIELKPDYYRSYYNRGLCYLTTMNYEVALKDLDVAINLNSDSDIVALYYNARGVCYLNLKNYERSLNDLENAVLLNPYFSIAYYNRSLCFFSLKNYVSSLSELDKAIEFCKLLEDKKQYLYLANEMATTAKEYNKARNYIEKLFESVDSKELLHKNIYLQSIDNAKEIDRKNQALKEKEVEMEDMMSMFAHKFRSPLDAIIYNTSHDNNPKLYTESANTMRGLLDIFSIISADDKILTNKIKNDNKGTATLISVLNKNLNMTLLHLLSVSGMSKIHQHYMNYAKAQGKITDAVSYKEWCDDYFEMEGELQKQWEQEFSVLLNQSASLAECLQWLERYFFKLDIIGFEINTIQFKEYETTESFLFILMNEILLNAFKYYASENKQPVILEWTATENDQILSCRNPSIRRERDQHKGSGKGHTFLSALARKTGCKFTKPKPQDDFLLEFAIPNQLLLSNSGVEK